MARIIELTDFTAPEPDADARLTERQLQGRDQHATPLFIA